MFVKLSGKPRTKRVLVYGWYYQGNIGDDFFIGAFRHLFPEISFVFTDHISVSYLQEVDAVFFGGGSFLYDAPNINNEALQLLKQKKIFYLGIGIEPNIHSIHLELMSQAQLIATRSSDQIDRIRILNKNSILIPDLVYSLQSQIVNSPKKNRSVLILPNSNVLPQLSDPHWKHAAWGYFKAEFAQFLDWLIEENYTVNFFQFCQAFKMHDQWAAYELLSLMNRRDNIFVLQEDYSKIELASQLLSQYSIVITQRYHGIVLSEMTHTPYISLYHHDKLKPANSDNGKFISYYGLSKRNMINAFNLSLKIDFANSLPIESNTFKTFSEKVIGLI
jgi:polysaccharide pyruvyl transferase WcaK-like protein